MIRIKNKLFLSSAIILLSFSAYAGGSEEDDGGPANTTAQAPDPNYDYSQKPEADTKSVLSYKGWTDIRIFIRTATGHNYSFYKGGTPYTILHSILGKTDEIKGNGITRTKVESVWANYHGALCPNMRWIEIDTNDRPSGHMFSYCSVEGLKTGDSIGIRAHENIPGMTVSVDVWNRGWKPALKETPLSIDYKKYELKW